MCIFYVMMVSEWDDVVMVGFYWCLMCGVLLEEVGFIYLLDVD